MLALWLLYPASAYLVGHPPLADVGLTNAVEANVTDRADGSAGHVLVVRVRVVLTLILWALAAAGALRDLRRRRLDIRVVLLIASPLMLFPAQAYGGEMLIRVSLFALPFVALQACSALLPDGGTRPSVQAAAVLVLTCFLLAVLTVTGRFGNARYDMFTDGEIDAVAAAQRLAPPGSAIISASHPTPWRSEAYLEHKYRTIDELCGRDLAAATCGPAVYDYIRHNPAGGVILLTRSAEASLVLQGTSSARGFTELKEWLSTQDGVELAFSNTDARVYQVPHESP